MKRHRKSSSTSYVGALLLRLLNEVYQYGKRFSEAISISTEVRVLTTPESVAQFLREMAVALKPSGSVA